MLSTTKSNTAILLNILSVLFSGLYAITISGYNHTYPYCRIISMFPATGRDTITPKPHIELIIIKVNPQCQTNSSRLFRITTARMIPRSAGE